MRKFKLKKDLPGIPAGSILKLPDGTHGYLNTEDGDHYSGLAVGLSAYGEDLLIYHPANERRRTVARSLGGWLEEIKTEPDYKRWRADFGGKYYFVYSFGNVLEDKEHETPGDNDRYNIGNYFKTKEEAQAVADYLKALAVVRDDAKGFKPDWADDGQSKYYVCYLHEREGLCLFDDVIRRHADNGVFGLPYFETQEDAKASIEKHEKEWKIIFGIKDKEEE